MNYFLSITDQFIDLIWGLPAVVLLLGTGLFLTVVTKAVQVSEFKFACKTLFNTKSRLVETDGKNKHGTISPYHALTVSLAGTVGVGNIAAVAAAIAVGGPGAIFWMWMTAIFGMATTYCCCVLSVKYREKDGKGNYVGGPMYVLKNGLNMPKLASLFAIFTVIAAIGSGNMMPANMMFDGLGYVIPAIEEYKLWLGLVTALLVGMIILGGIQRIGSITGKVVPLMCGLYLLAALYIIINNISAVPSAFFTIFNHALNPWAVGGGAIGAAIQFGVARGLFSNEAGQGSIPIAHAVANTKCPKTQGLIAMLGPFIDTIIICTMTALVIIIMGAWGDKVVGEIEGTKLAVHAFHQGMGNFGAWIVSIGMVFFSFSTIIAWSYYGEAAIKYLVKKNTEMAIFIYRIVYSVMVVFGVNLHLNLVWNIADIGMAFMMVPNLIALLLLFKVLKHYTNKSLS